MCNDENCPCHQPHRLKSTPEECSEEQIQACHGDVKDHPCTPPPDCPQGKGETGQCSPEQIKKCHGD